MKNAIQAFKRLFLLSGARQIPVAPWIARSTALALLALLVLPLFQSAPCAHGLQSLANGTTSRSEIAAMAYWLKSSTQREGLDR